MDFGISLSDFNSAAQQPLTMQSATPSSTDNPTANPVTWNPELVSLPDSLALANLTPEAIAQIAAQLPPIPHADVGQKRTHSQMQAPALIPASDLAVDLATDISTELSTDQSQSQSQSQSYSHSHSHQTSLVDTKPSLTRGDTVAPTQATSAAVTPTTTDLLAQPKIDSNAVCQMGGLPYAELCKERAREEFKEAKRNEHLANGDFDRTKRRKKNDTTMTPRQKYIRRLRMNQDSAAAARHAQEVYVNVLEKLVKTSEDEKKTFSLEMQHIRDQNALLQKKVVDLQARVNELEEEQQNNCTTINWDKTKDPILASKLLDFIASTPVIGAQPDLGVQPARAV